MIDPVTLTLPSLLASVETVEITAETFALAAGFDPDTASQIAMVTREAAVNAIVHGNRYATDKQITAHCEVTASSLKIQVADQGAGLDPDQIPDPLAPENIMRSSGRGVFLMRALMDEVHFRQLTPGTEITLIKHRIL